MPRAAARLFDHHACPKPAHEGGPVVGPGEPAVVIGGAVAARFSDMVRCTGAAAMDAVAMGAPTVVIGKLLACRVGDPTEHGGVVLTGQANVLVGEPPPGVTAVRRGKMILIVNHNAHTILIVGVQEFEGAGATPEYIAAATECINETWSGPTTFEGQTYDAECMVTGRPAGSIVDPLADEIQVVKTQDPIAVTSNKDPSNQALYGNGKGYQHSTDLDDGHVVAAHEFGHAMGLPDEYIERPPVEPGKRNVVHTGPPGGVMGYIEPGSRPTPENFGSLITGKGLAAS